MERRRFLKKSVSALALSLFRPVKVTAQYIPIAYWQVRNIAAMAAQAIFVVSASKSPQTLVKAAHIQKNVASDSDPGTKVLASSSSLLVCSAPSPAATILRIASMLWSIGGAAGSNTPVQAGSTFLSVAGGGSFPAAEVRCGHTCLLVCVKV